MNSIKAGRPVIDLVRLCYEANRPLLLVGRHGVGKSQMVDQAARELGIRSICRDLTLMEPPDLVGLPKLDGKVTRFFPPAFLPTGGKGLLFLDELNRCPPYMRAPCLQLLTNRTLNDYTLPPGWLPVAAMNPPGGRYDVDDLDPAVLSRFVLAAVKPDREGWLDWARQKGVHPAVISYVESEHTIFDQAQSNPRAWTYVSDFLHADPGSPASRKALTTAISGLVGARRTAAFLRVLRDDAKPLGAPAVLDYVRHRRTVQGWIAAGRLDLVRSTILALQKQLQSRPNYEQARSDTGTWKNIGDFLGDLPGDLREEARTFLVERGYDVPRTRRRPQP